MAPIDNSARFPTTAWSCVNAAKDPLHPQYQLSVNRLITNYWRPVFHFLCAHHNPAPQAAELTQEFFLRMVQKNWLQTIDAQKGHFRTFLLVLVKRCAYNLTVDAGNQVKFEKDFVSINSLMADEDRTYEPPAGETPEQAFSRQWKQELFASVRRNLQAFYQGLNDETKNRWFAIFAAYHLIERTEHQPSQEALAARFGVSRDEVRKALMETQRRYERFLRQEIRDQIGPDEDVEDELRQLMNDG